MRLHLKMAQHKREAIKMKINKKEGILIVVVLFVITFAAYYVYFLMPTLDEISNSRAAIEQKDIQIQSMQAQIGQIPSLNQQIVDIKQQIAANNENIPRGVNEALQLVEIANVFNKASISDKDKPNHKTLVVVFNNSPDGYGNYQKNRVDINFSTDYENLKQILDDFDNLSMENQIVKIDVMNTEDLMDYYSQLLEGFYLSVGLTIEFYTFFEDTEQEAPETQSFESTIVVQEDNPFIP